MASREGQAASTAKEGMFSVYHINHIETDCHSDLSHLNLDRPRRREMEINLDRPARGSVTNDPPPAEGAQGASTLRITCIKTHFFTFLDITPLNLDRPARQHLQIDLDRPLRQDSPINLDRPVKSAGVANDLPNVNLEHPVQSLNLECPVHSLNLERPQSKFVMDLDRPGHEDPAINLDHPVRPPAASTRGSTLNLDRPNRPP